MNIYLPPGTLGNGCCLAEAPLIGEERLAGQPTADGTSCGHEPVGKPDSKVSKVAKKCGHGLCSQTLAIASVRDERVIQLCP